jgi:cysteinyl-tRNA synthetase
MPLRVYNTLTQTKELFHPVVSGEVGMYVCGPTVYSKSHIGHMVGPVIFDTIKRYLVYLGFKVNWVLNITDVDDKLIVQAQKDGTTVRALAEQVTRDYLDCLEALGVDGVDHMPRATEHIAEIVAINQGLIDKGFAYASGGDVYFDVTRAPQYGKLSHRDPEELMAGARIETSSLKRNAGDFALWKSSKPGEPSWDSPWGPGRPGWHIECSAMSMKYLGQHFDIHGGGLDLVFPHHENELVQSESYTGVPFASFWLHNGLLTKDGKKISKSDPGTIVLMSDLLKAHAPDTLRVLLLSSHYRRPIDYGPTRLHEIERGLQTFLHFFERFREITGEDFYCLVAPTRKDELGNFVDVARMPDPVTELRNEFLEKMDDDFNTGGALGVLYDLVHLLNKIADEQKLEPKFPETGAFQSALPAFRDGAIVLKELSQILGLFCKPSTKDQIGGDALTPQLLDLLLDLRSRLRKEKNFALADEVRNRLTGLGVTLEDRPDGTRWRIEPRR